MLSTDTETQQLRERVRQLEMSLAEARAATQTATQEAHVAARQRAEGQARLAAVERAREAGAVDFSRRQLELEQRMAEEREARLVAERGMGWVPLPPPQPVESSSTQPSPALVAAAEAREAALREEAMWQQQRHAAAERQLATVREELRRQEARHAEALAQRTAELEREAAKRREAEEGLSELQSRERRMTEDASAHARERAEWRGEVRVWRPRGRRRAGWGGAGRGEQQGYAVRSRAVHTFRSSPISTHCARAKHPPPNATPCPQLEAQATRLNRLHEEALERYRLQLERETAEAIREAERRAAESRAVQMGARHALWRHVTLPHVCCVASRHAR